MFSSLPIKLAPLFLSSICSKDTFQVRTVTIPFKIATPPPHSLLCPITYPDIVFFLAFIIFQHLLKYGVYIMLLTHFLPAKNVSFWRSKTFVVWFIGISGFMPIKRYGRPSIYFSWINEMCKFQLFHDLCYIDCVWLFYWVFSLLPLFFYFLKYYNKQSFTKIFFSVIFSSP